MHKFLAMATGLVLLTACGKSETPAPTSETNNQTATVAQSPTNTVSPTHNPNYKTYNVGSEASYEPFSFKNEMGTVVGFEVDLLNAIGEVAQFNVNFVDTSRSQVVDTLNSGRFDIWASALSVSPERLETMSMSEPYLDFARELYVLDKPENASLQSASDFAGKKIAVNEGSSSAIEFAQKITGNKENVVLARSFYLSVTSTIQGKSDATLGDSRILQYYQLKHPEIKARMVDVGESKKQIAFAVKKDNQEMLDKINQGLNTIKQNGTYDKLVEKWFGAQK